MKQPFLKESIKNFREQQVLLNQAIQRFNEAVETGTIVNIDAARCELTQVVEALQVARARILKLTIAEESL